MTEVHVSVTQQMCRQAEHWVGAARALAELDSFASADAWRELELHVGIALRRRLDQAVSQLVREGDALLLTVRAIATQRDLDNATTRLLDFRGRFLETETLLDFYGDAVSTRTGTRMGAVLRGCDLLARRSMQIVLDQLGISTPPCMTFLDRGLGAAILRANLRYGGTTSPVAAIKLVRHNLHRPTSLLHEAGHQVAHLTGWTDEVRRRFEVLLEPGLATVWSGWASELVADVIAFAHTGYASVTGLQDVLAASAEQVLTWSEFDPHPIPYLRVLFGIEMAVRCYGQGPWGDAKSAWIASYPLDSASAGTRALIKASLSRLPEIAELCLFKSFGSFRGRALADLVPPERVSPTELERLEQRAGAALYVSPRWLDDECLRVLALSGMRSTTDSPAGRAAAVNWLARLGGFRAAA